jgi:tetratricopeptide (TPR) repeat protein
LLGVYLTVASALFAGQFRYGLGRGDSLKVKVPTAPGVRIGRASLAIEVKDSGIPAVPAQGSTADPSVPLSQLQAALDQVFRESYMLLQSNAEASLRVVITHYTPAESRIDALTQKMRVPAPPNPDGTAVIDPQTGQALVIERAVAVEQWTARGQISARVEVVDSTGVLIDAFAPQATIRATQVISMDGQDRVDRTQLPTNDQVKAKLIADLVVQFVPRYCPPAVELEIPLAVDEALRAGNKQAQAGDYAAAAKMWQEAALKDTADEGDRLHNIGTVYEAQGYGVLLKQGSPSDAEPYFAKAGKQYAAAAELDPKEKYLTRASDRVRKAMGLVQAIRDLEGKRQQSLAAKASPSGVQQVVFTPSPSPAPATFTETPQPTASVFTPVQPAVAPAVDPVAEEAIQKALTDPRSDTGPEAQFRQVIRLRIRASQVEVSEEIRKQLESTGAVAFSLSPLQSRRVVHQEAQQWAQLLPKLGIYRDTYAAFAQDGKITPEERQALGTLGKNLGMADGDVKGIESAIAVKE